MQRILLAIALAASLPSLHADQAHAATAPAATAGVMHAGLSGPAQEAARQREDRAAEQRAADAAAAQPEGEGDSSSAMLLTGLALMAGIALRRWSSVPQ